MIRIALSVAESYQSESSVIRRICNTINGEDTPLGYLNRPTSTHCHTVSARYIKSSAKTSSREVLLLIGINNPIEKVLHSIIISDVRNKQIVSDSFSNGQLNPPNYVANSRNYVVLNGYYISDIKKLAADMDNFDTNFMPIRNKHII